MSPSSTLTAPITLTAYVTNLTANAESRTITGTIAKYEHATDDRRGLIFHTGSITPRMPLDRVKLLRDHDHKDPVGYLISYDEATLEATFYVPPTESGDRALLEASPEYKLRDGLSMGVVITEYTFGDDDLIHVYASIFNEVSLCAVPAFTDAGVSNVTFSSSTTPPTLTAQPIKETIPMPTAALESVPLTAEQLDAALSSHTLDIDRHLESRLADLSSFAPQQAALQWATPGEFLQALSRRDQAAIDFHGAFEGGTIKDTHIQNTWIADAIHFVEERRAVTNIFQRETLPELGMTLEYLKDDTDTTVVEKQENEGDSLKSGKITLTSASTEIGTYGGATSLSRQVIDRANASYITTSFRAMLRAYARSTEVAVRAGVKKLIADQITAGNKLELAGGETDDWLDLIVDVAGLMDDRGFQLDGLLVSPDVFKRLTRLKDGNGNRLVHISGTAVNQVGTVDLTGLTGELASVKFRLLPGAAAATAAFYDQQAYTSWENAGAPMQLTDQKPIELVEEFAYYGYLAHESQFPKAIVPVTGISALPALRSVSTPESQPAGD